jgi:hypothetical protein
MTASARSLTKRPAWEALAVHHNKVKGLHLRDLFSADHKRGERLTAEATGLFLDYSKNRVTERDSQTPRATGGGVRLARVCARSLLPETGDTLIAEEVRKFPTRK